MVQRSCASMRCVFKLVLCVCVGGSGVCRMLCILCDAFMLPSCVKPCSAPCASAQEPSDSEVKGSLAVVVFSALLGGNLVRVPRCRGQIKA